MDHWITTHLLLAQERQGAEPSPFFTFLPLILIFVVFYFLMLRPQRTEQRRHEEMLKALKKNDRVVTIGGIIGSVANISPDGKEVTLKVDDNTRIKFLKSSIQRVLVDEEPPKTT